MAVTANGPWVLTRPWEECQWPVVGQRGGGRCRSDAGAKVRLKLENEDLVLAHAAGRAQRTL